MKLKDWEYTRKTGKEIFAEESGFEYQLFPISHFADKLITIGCNTIGVQDDRMDEQVKRFYDVAIFTTYRLENCVMKLKEPSTLALRNRDRNILSVSIP